MERIGTKSKPLFNKKLCSDLLDLSDGRLHTEDGTTFQIHKIELAKNSEYFYRLFCGIISKGKTDFLIPGISGEALGHILSFIYSGKVTITESNVCELLIAADYLLLDDLIADIMSIYMRKMAITNCLPLFFAALKIGRNDMLQECFRYISTRFESVAAADCASLVQLPQSVLEQFLSDKNLCVRDEALVWRVICTWVEADADNRRHLVRTLMQCLAMSDINDELAKRILESPVVASNPFCSDILKEIECRQNQTSLDALRSYLLKERGSGGALYRRIPQNIHFIAHYCVHNQTDGVFIYTTYDEEIDLWRKIVEIDECPEFILAVGHDIYLFTTNEYKSLRYSLVDKEWSLLPRLNALRTYYSVVSLDGLVYAIGGISSATQEEINFVEAYSLVDNEWYHVAPMMPVRSFWAVTMGGNIYVVGNAPQFFTFDMVAQIYSEETDSWAFLPSPSIFRFNFALVGYRGQLFVLGGRNEDEYLKNVEVFDPDKQEWFEHVQLPYTFYLPKAIVLNGRLIVYDNHLEDRTYLKTYPALMWDEDKKYWRPFEENSPMNSIHKYCFFSPDSEECTDRIARENKDPSHQFTKSPFT